MYVSSFLHYQITTTLAGVAKHMYNLEKMAVQNPAFEKQNEPAATKSMDPYLDLFAKLVRVGIYSTLGLEYFYGSSKGRLGSGRPLQVWILWPGGERG